MTPGMTFLVWPAKCYKACPRLAYYAYLFDKSLY